MKLALALRRSSSERFNIELGIHDYVREHSDLEIICCNGRHSLSWDEALTMKADALIGYFHQPSHLKSVLDRGIPSVCINSVFNHTEISCVRADSYAIGVMAAEYFLPLNCVNYVYVTDVPEHHYSTQRQHGFSDHLHQSGLEANSISSESLEPATLYLQKKITTGERTAVFCVNDRLARALLNSLESANLKLEDNLIVLGVDNDPFYYENGSIIFSSIDVNHRRIGYLAAERVHQQSLDPAITPSCTEVPPLKLHNRYDFAKNMRNQHPALGLVFQKINANYADPELNATAVASHCGLSVRSLNRILKESGHPPLAANILQARIRVSKELLKHSNLNLEQIAYTVGFNEYTTFFRAFKKSTGSSPSDFR